MYISCMRRDLIVKLSYISPYKTFSKKVGFIKYYLHGVSDAGSRLLCSGTHE